MSQLSKEQKKQLALGLHESGLVNFGEFTFKSGVKSPIYNNLRNLMSHPKLLKTIANYYAQITDEIDYQVIGAIPYGAISMAAALSLETDIGWICARKESKDYGMAKDIVGDFAPGQKMLLIDDLVTNGDSKIESMVSFNDAQLIVKDIAVILDYDKGASKLLADKGYNLISMMTVKEVVEIIHSENLIDDAKFKQCEEFLAV